MDIKTKTILPAVISGMGVMSGGFMFTELVPKKIKEVLEFRGKTILNSTGNDELWLVLAQKYRENGTISPRKERDFSKQVDPGFLNKSDWNTFVKQIITDGKTSKNEFERDEKISELLKKRCLSALDQNYTENLYSSVLSWCWLDLPNYSKEILRIQKDNGNCRFWLVASDRESTGQFVWEASNIWISQQRLFLLKVGLKQIVLDSNRNTYKKAVEKGKQILEQCKKKPNSYVELSFQITEDIFADKVWKLKEDWFNKEHRSTDWVLEGKKL